MLCGILAINPIHEKEKWFEQLSKERLVLGNVMGNMEGWLGIRSVRTLEVRVQRQAENAGRLVRWLDSAVRPEKYPENERLSDEEREVISKVLVRVEHASLQEEDIKDGWLLKQMPNGFGPVFSIVLKEVEFAKCLPSKLGLFHHATSLGGVESLIEWRAMTDPKVDTKLLRVSVGIEGWEDLKADIIAGFKALVE